MRELTTGGNLLCAGNGTFSKAIQFYNRVHGATGLPVTISHTAKVVRQQGILWVAESTTMNEWRGKSGYQVNRYEDWLENYDGKVYYQHLTFQNKPGWGAKERRDAFEICRMDLYGRSYESGLGGTIELISSYGEDRLYKEAMEHGESYPPISDINVFCSESNIIADQAMGIIDKRVKPHKMSPLRFADGTYAKLLRGCVAEELERVK